MVLFVGAKRLCQQIAYVLNVQDYAMVEKLTAQNFDQYREHQIYVCEFKRQSRKLVARAVARTATNLQYFDDICRTIDEAYYAKRERHKKHAQQENDSAIQPMRRSLWHFIKRGGKHPLLAARYLLLWLKLRVKTSISKPAHPRRKPDKLPNNLVYLYRLKPSDLLRYVLRAPINDKIQCCYLETKVRITANYEVKGCCSAIVPFGHLLHDGELDEIYHSAYARIVKLSSLNRSYCLCNFNGTCKGYCPEGEPSSTEAWQTPKLPEYLFLSFDHSCNLCCKACRTAPYLMDVAARRRATLTVAKLLRSGWLEQVDTVCMAGAGEIFYSPYYRQLLTTDLQRQQIEILSNGTLFNDSNWQLVAGKYKTIDVQISVDAATAETYRKLRGADFDNLMKNLNMLSDLHRQKKIRKFGLNFVVQRDNFREMPAFVKLGQSLGVDHIQFQRMNYFGGSVFAAEKLRNYCLIIDDKYLEYDLWCVLQDPIFKDRIVNLKGLQRYIDASERRYRKRYNREQRNH